jgi:YidC/Oxa1 family membrane protein insertase
MANIFSLRNVLLASVIFVGYLIFNAWEEEHPMQTTAATATAPAIPATAEPAGEVIPGQQVQSSPAEAQQATVPFIHVSTDVYELDINPLGGSIEKLALRQYPASTTPNAKPLSILSADPSELYLAQSGLISLQGPDSTTKQALLRAEKTNYEMGDTNTLSVPLSWTNGMGLHVKKIFTFDKNSYQVKVTYEINNQSTTPWQGQIYEQLKRKEPASTGGFLNFSTFVGGAISTQETPFEKVKFSEMEESNLSKVTQSGWIAMLQQYFLSAWIPNAQQNNHFYSLKNADQVYTLGSIGPIYTVAPGQTVSMTSAFYAGPLIASTLAKVAPHLDLTLDYGLFWYIATGLFYLMKTIYQWIGNWGWAIVLLTVAVKLILYWPSAATYRSAFHMRQIQPKIQAIKEKFGNDKMELHKAISELYKKEKVNPFGGCLPMLLQLPVFFALYWVIIESVELRHAPFIWWIQDLSAKDPYYIFPALMCLTMFVQQKMAPTSADPMQAKVMLFMPVAFSALMINFPVGLVIYWVVNNILSILQQWYVNKMCERTLALK